YAPDKTNLPANDPRKNSVAQRIPNPSNLRLVDAKPNQIPSLTGSDLAGRTNTDTDNFNGYRSNRCASSADDVSICKKGFPFSKPDGSTDTTKSTLVPSHIWTGRYQCVPTDRFYVQLVYRHTWITPFLPTVNTS